MFEPLMKKKSNTLTDNFCLHNISLMIKSWWPRTGRCAGEVFRKIYYIYQLISAKRYDLIHIFHQNSCWLSNITYPPKSILRFFLKNLFKLIWSSSEIWITSNTLTEMSCPASFRHVWSSCFFPEGLINKTKWNISGQSKFRKTRLVFLLSTWIS